MIAELLAAEMQGDEGYIADFSGQLLGNLLRLVALGGMERHFVAEDRGDKQVGLDMLQWVCNHSTEQITPRQVAADHWNVGSLNSFVLIEMFALQAHACSKQHFTIIPLIQIISHNLPKIRTVLGADDSTKQAFQSSNKDKPTKKAYSHQPQ